MYSQAYKTGAGFAVNFLQRLDKRISSQYYRLYRAVNFFLGIVMEYKIGDELYLLYGKISGVILDIDNRESEPYILVRLDGSRSSFWVWKSHTRKLTKLDKALK